MDAEVYKIEWIGGPCPMQAWGTVDGDQFAFRSRWDRWSFTVSNDPKVEPDDIESSEQGYFVEQLYGGRYGAGYMPENEARKIIDRDARTYYARKLKKAEQ